MLLITIFKSKLNVLYWLFMHKFKLCHNLLTFMLFNPKRLMFIFETQWRYFNENAISVTPLKEQIYFSFLFTNKHWSTYRLSWCLFRRHGITVKLTWIFFYNIFINFPKHYNFGGIVFFNWRGRNFIYKCLNLCLMIKGLLGWVICGRTVPLKIVLKYINLFYGMIQQEKV